MSGERYGVLIDLRRCTGCQTCQVSCKSENQVPLGSWRTWVKQIEKGRYPNVTRSFLPILCNNCEAPACVTVCPTKASIRRNDGIVIVDPHRCIGCGYCMAACPYSVRYIHPLLGIVQKCDWCSKRIDAGLSPACVTDCPTRAIFFGNLNDPQSLISKMIAKLPTHRLKTDMGTEPRTFYIGLDEYALREI
jgi:tetrathionate reductase subunit B